MVQALVSAKTQTVKEIKKKSSIKRRNKLIVKLILITIVAILIALILSKIVVETRTSFTNNDIDFKSVNFHIHEGFEIFGTDKNYLLVFNYYYQDTNYLSSVIDGLVFSQSMLSAKNKNTILLISVIDNENNLLYCQSNNGNVLENIELTSEECLSLLDTNHSVIMVNYPFGDVEKSEVVLNLNEKLLLINPKSKEFVYDSLYVSFNQMYKDAKMIEDSLTDIQNKLSTSKEKSLVDKNIIDENIVDENFYDQNILIDENFSDDNSLNDDNFSQDINN
ncbi:hypothetical protein GW835_03690 [archaeon]|nr:hypothetical protein [archaeon]NCP79638.1 hypothetical protein [archaeon]NCP98291.1 hypothetical protein [archaeon]NCQ07405.1 hypothetical protein [archaeon]NCQ51201.1 hypothetical protein [archaeon]